MFIPLDLAKKHLNIEEDFHDDDEYILGLIDVAEKSVRVHVNEDMNTIAEKNGGEIPSPLFQAMLLLIGSLYRDRETTGTKVQKLPYGYQYLIELYKNWEN